MSEIAEKKISVQDVKTFWECHPLLSSRIPYPPGSEEFFRTFDDERERIEPPFIQRQVYDFQKARGKKVLDVGCGNGWVLSKFFGEGAKCFGCDLTQRAIEISSRRFNLLKGEAIFIVANAEELPFKDSSFDIITAMGVLHHTPKTTEAIQEIYRVLKTGGKFVLMLYHKNSILYRFYMPLRLLIYLFKRIWDPVSLRDLVNKVDGEGNPLGKVYSRSEVKRMVSHFKNVRTLTYLVEAYEIPLVGRLLGVRFREILSYCFGWFLYTWGTKPNK